MNVNQNSDMCSMQRRALFFLALQGETPRKHLCHSRGRENYGRENTVPPLQTQTEPVFSLPNAEHGL